VSGIIRELGKLIENDMELRQWRVCDVEMNELRQEFFFDLEVYAYL
jgi:hypothetical protein